jgi:hypothetical protein
MSPVMSPHGGDINRAYPTIACAILFSSIDSRFEHPITHASAHDTTLNAAPSSAREEAEVLRAEARRLLSVVRRLEDKKNLEERLAFLAQELERTRAKVTGQIRT